MTYKIGCDPEVFLKDQTGRFVSAHDIIPGTKLEPFPVKYGAIQVDGAAAEFNTDPAMTYDTFIHNINTVMSDLRNRAMAKNLELVIEPTVTFEPSYFNTLPDHVKELGCNPDFNAYTGQVNPAPDGEATTMRTASGHIHIGWCEGVNPMDPVHFDDCLLVVKQLDYFLGLPSLMWDKDNKRRSLYGKAGAFRPKPYGVEYRTLSNVWLRSAKLQKWIFDSVQHALSTLNSSSKTMFDKHGEYARDCIDNNRTEWHTTLQGATIFNETGLHPPPLVDILNTPKKPTKNKVKPYPDWIIDDDLHIAVNS